MQIYCFKLSTGEEVVARANITNEFFLDNSIELSDPISFIPTQQGVAAMPWPSIGSTKNVTLNNQHCVAICDVRSEIQQAYVKATSGIDIPTTSNLII